MDIYDFKANHLLETELDYELKIRVITTVRNVADKRKIFARIQKREQTDPGKEINLILCTLNYEDESSAIRASLRSIKKVIDEFEGDINDSAFRRVKSRLAHVTGRAKRIPLPADNKDSADQISAFIQDTTATCLLYEADLYEKLGPVPDPEPSVSRTPVINVAAPVVHCATRNIPICEWQLNFNGDPKKLYPFLERLTELAQARDVSHKDLFNSAAEFFTGDAFVWYRSIKSTLNDWDSLIAKLKKDFLHDDIDDDLWDQIKRRKQKKNESTVVFIAHLEALFQRLSRPPAEISKVKHIRRNILPEFINRLALIDINTVSELSELCRKLEESDYMREKSKPKDEVASFEQAGSSQNRFSNSNNRQNQNNNFNNNFKNSSRHFSNRSNFKNKNQSNNKNSSSAEAEKKDNKSKTSIVCWNCRLANHTYLDCRAPKKVFCFKCGEANAKMSTCPKCSKN